MFLFVQLRWLAYPAGGFPHRCGAYAAQLQGNFSAGSTKVINDPLTGAPFPEQHHPAQLGSVQSQRHWQSITRRQQRQPGAEFHRELLEHRRLRLRHVPVRLAGNEQARFDGAVRTFRTWTSILPEPSRPSAAAQPQRFQNVVAGLTSIITPRFLNEFRASYGRTINRTMGQNSGQSDRIPSRSAVCSGEWRKRGLRRGHRPRPIRRSRA